MTPLQSTNEVGDLPSGVHAVTLDELIERFGSGSEQRQLVTNDHELQVTKQRIEHFQRWLAQLRQTAQPEEFESITSGYRLEIERMQAEVLEYLLSPVPVEHEMQLA